MVSGILHLIAGVSLGIAVSWFAANVLTDYNDPIRSAAGGLRYVYGEALFIGWVNNISYIYIFQFPPPTS